MVDWFDDVYSSPEKHDLELVGEVQWDEPCWSFDLTVVWFERYTGTFYWDSDSGCSCPSPFENVLSKDDLEKGTFHEAADALQARMQEQPEDTLSDEAPGEVVDLIGRMREL